MGVQGKLSSKMLLARLHDNPRDGEAVLGLRDHYARRGDMTALANLMAAWAELLEDGYQAADAFVQAGDAAIRLDDLRQAQNMYERALKRAPEHRVAADRLRRALEDLGDHPRLLEWLNHLIKVAEQSIAIDSVFVAEMHQRAAQILESHFGNELEAAKRYQRAFELDPQLSDAVAAARAIYRRAGNAQAVAVLYEFEIKASRDRRQQHALLCEIAYVRARQLADWGGAVAALRRALEIEPNDAEVMGYLAECLISRVNSGQSKDAAADRKRAAQCFCMLARRASLRDASQYVDAALRCAPDLPAARKLQARLRQRLSERREPQSDEEPWEWSGAAGA